MVIFSDMPDFSGMLEKDNREGDFECDDQMKLTIYSFENCIVTDREVISIL